jgi:hypothetical protein
MRRIAVISAALALFFSQTVAAAENAGQGPLAPGKPAGLAKAQLNNHQLFIYLTVTAALGSVAGAFLLIKNRHSSSNAATTPAAPDAAATPISSVTSTAT